MPPLTDSAYCFSHDPSRAADRARGRKLGGRNRRRPSRYAVPEELQLRDVPAVQSVIERAVIATLQLENGHQRNRTLGYLAGLALHALEVGDIEARLEALEAAAGTRRSA